MIDRGVLSLYYAVKMATARFESELSCQLNLNNRRRRATPGGADFTTPPRNSRSVFFSLAVIGGFL